MVSRCDAIKRAGKFIGLAAAHFALFGQSFREGMLYEMEAREIVRLRKLNDNEITLLVETARARGTKKIHDHFATPGKTQRAGLNKNNHGNNIDAKSFAAQARFFLEDDFHRNMLENQQLGLSYYLRIAAEMYAATNAK